MTEPFAALPIRVAVQSRSGDYTIAIANGLIDHLRALLHAADLEGRPFAISSPLVWQFHGRTMTRALPGIEPILVPDGERFKHLQTAARIYEALIHATADRSSLIIALGGGVIGDMAGFAAATYLRGVRFVQVPTTVMAQVDAAIGGKVGVNHALGKNLIGAFYPPRLVVVDPTVLGTLPRREFRAGLYEIVKYGMTSSRALFDRFDQNVPAVFARDPSVLVPLITESCRIKAAVVSNDEREAGPRRVLNFGHTAGHALETVTRYRRFRHGEAVGYGMLVAAELAVARGALAETERRGLAGLIAKLGPLPPVGDLSTAHVLDAMRHDKKVTAGRLHVVLTTAIGATTIVDDVTDAEMTRTLKRIGLRS